MKSYWKGIENWFIVLVCIFWRIRFVWVELFFMFIGFFYVVWKIFFFVEVKFFLYKIFSVGSIRINIIGFVWGCFLIWCIFIFFMGGFFYDLFCVRWFIMCNFLRYFGKFGIYIFFNGFLFVFDFFFVYNSFGWGYRNWWIRDVLIMGMNGVLGRFWIVFVYFFSICIWLFICWFVFYGIMLSMFFLI